MITPNLFSSDPFSSMAIGVHNHFKTVKGPLFTTNIDGEKLWAAWLSGFSPDRRQEHNCHSCRRFVEKYGGLVYVDAQGGLHSAIFTAPTTDAYEDAFANVLVAIHKSKITGVFLSPDKIWGQAVNHDKKRGKDWEHFSVQNPAPYSHALLTADQRMAELHEEYAMLRRAMAEFKLETVQAALQIVQNESLSRGEKVKGRLEWLAALYGVSSNLVWVAIATAPPGFAHVKSGMVGTLLEDLASGKSFAAVKAAFDAKMDPLKYQRPVAPVSEGNVKQAEAIVEKLGVGSALKRRFARLDEIKLAWRPLETKDHAKSGGVFSHLLGKSDSPMQTTGPTMTYEKFQREILPKAEAMAVYVGFSGNFVGLVTAEDSEAPPILQWDALEARNPVSSYTYHGATPASRWGLSSGYQPVTGVSLMPNMWQPGFEHHSKGALFILKGCRDSGQPGLALFPEILKTEFHSIRNSIEAFSKNGKMSGYETASACGVAVSGRSGIKVRVLVKGVQTDYTIDRWD